jgi:hypothetical protein
MKDNFSSKRRFYLNKKDKNNSYTKTNEKNDFGVEKTEFNRNKEKVINIEENINKFSRFKKNNNDDSNKKNYIKNFILFSNINESKNSKKDEIKNINYFRFSGSNKKLFSQKDYINSSNKINNNNLQTNQGNNKLNGNNYNNSFEINYIKSKVKNDFKETYNKNKNPFLNTGNNKTNNTINNIISSVKITNDSNKEKEKKEGANQERKIRFFSSFYGFRNKKKEIIKIQSVWRGYYFRLKNIGKIKLNIFSIKTSKLLFKIFNNKKRLFFKEFFEILKNYRKKNDKFGKIKNVDFTVKFNGSARKFYNSNQISNIRHVNINDNDNNSPRNKANTNNIKTYSKLSEINAESNKKRRDKYKNKEKNINDIDDIFNGPLKIIYIPKKIYNKNRYYYMKRITNIKKLKLEKFMKFIKKKFLSIYFNIFKNSDKSNSNYFKIKKLVNSIDLILKNYLRNYLKIYREKILDIKVKEEVMKKKTLSILNESDDNDIKLLRQKKILNENKAEKKSSMKLKRNIEKNIKVKFLQNNLADDIIIENINESENEDENQKNNTKLKNEKYKFMLLNKIVSKKIEYNLIILNKYFNLWKQFSNLFNNNGPRIKFRNMHSPDMEIRGNKSKKKHIKIKLSRALTSKTSLSSIKSEGRSNSSSHFYIKKMRVRSVVINTNNYSIINFRTENVYNRNTKLFSIINKINDKSDIIKCFKIWKKGKRNRMSLSFY